MGGGSYEKGLCERSIEGLEVERSKNIRQERKRKGLDAKDSRVVVVGWEMVRDWMQRTCEVVGGRWEGIGCKEHACWGGGMGDGKGLDAKNV